MRLVAPPLANRVERTPYRLSPEQSDPGLNPALGNLLACTPLYLPYLPLSVSLSKNAKQKSFKR